MGSNIQKIHALESEKAVIASFLAGDPTIEVIDLLRPDDFFDPHCRSWFSVILKLFEQNSTIAPDTVAAYLHSQGNLNGDEMLLIDLSGKYISDPMLHAKIIKDFALRRRYGVLAAKIKTEVDKMTDSFEIGDMVQNDLMEISGSISGGTETLSGSLVNVLEEARLTAEGKIVHPQTGISSVDAVINGLRPGQMIIVAARPSIGKTALALSIARNTATAGVSTDFYSLEQPQNELVARLVSIETGLSVNRIYSGHDNDSADIYRAQKKIIAMEPYLRIDDRSFESMAALRSRIKNNIMRHNTRVVFVDYLGQIEVPYPSAMATKDLQVGYITRSLKHIARDYKITIVLLCQLNRNVEGRVSNKPVLSDLRDSGNIEQDADVVIFISRDKEANNGTATLHISKNRNGKTFDVEVAFRSECMHFADLAYENIQPPVF